MRRAAVAARRLILLVLAGVALSGCSFDYENLELDEQEKNQIPDIRLNNLSERVYEDNNKILELKSDVLLTFESRGIQEIEGLTFLQYNEDGELALEGRADYASRNLEYDDIILSGGVEIIIHESGAEISGERFVYSGKQQLVWADNNTEIQLSQDDGSVLRGKGFVADLLTSELRFDRGANGVIATSEPGDENNEPEDR